MVLGEGLSEIPTTGTYLYRLKTVSAPTKKLRHQWHQVLKSNFFHDIKYVIRKNGKSPKW